MPDVDEALQAIANARRQDPLAPVTVVSPSHAAALQLRRRLAALGAFAAVRFEPLPRLAELIGAGHLAGAGRLPLARPIADYVAEQVALDSRPPLDSVSDVPGYARVLRQIFRRLRRGGIRSSADVMSPRVGHMAEVLRLYDSFRARTREFYDEEDLLEAAADAVRSGRAGVLADLGDVYIAPPGPQTAAGAALVEALAEGGNVTVLDEAGSSPQQSFLVVPDPASEAKEVVRLVLKALAEGAALGEIAVFHGAAEGYGRLLREAFSAAEVPAVPLPGIPVAETAAGRGVLMLARMPSLDYARTAVIDFLSVAPVRAEIPGAEGRVYAMTTAWDKTSRDAQITHGLDAWRDRLATYAAKAEADAARLDVGEYGWRIESRRREAERARTLAGVIEALARRLEPLRQPLPAADFIAAFKGIIEEYIERGAPGREEALEEIDQLGTVGAIGGSFALDAFTEALGANLEARYIRPEKLGNGVIIADYRAAAGMRFQRVVLCGAFEGALPAGPGTDSILDDGAWQALKGEHPFIEDVETRLLRGREAAARAVASAGDGWLAWTAPAFQPGGAREYYPSPLMAAAYSELAGRRTTASELRAGAAGESLQRLPSPLAAALRGPVLTEGELAIREAVKIGRGPLPAGHPRRLAVDSLRARRGSLFSEWDGNVAALNEPGWLEIQKAVAPTALEKYAMCGFRYFLGSLLGLRAIEEPDERQMMDAATRGSLVHEILESFFREQQARGRPQAGEAWTDADRARLLAIADEVLGRARTAGQAGLDIFAQHESRTIRADLARFLDADTLFRRETGGRPTDFEVAIPETEVAGVRLRGRADRVDRTEDGTKAWVIDYKTGSAREFEKMDDDPLMGGAKLQLPVYLSLVSDAGEATALYWFVTQRSGFLRIPYSPSPERDERFRATLRAIVEGVRAGAFPAVPGEEDEWYNAFANCGFCEFTRLCSRRRDLEFAAKEGDPAMVPWHGVKQAAAPGAEP